MPSAGEKSLFFNQHDGPYTDREIAPVIAATMRRGPGRYRGLLMGSQAVPAASPGDTFLVNLDSASGSGTHWGILRRSVQKPSTFLWLDSLGLMPPRPITASIRKAGLQVEANDGAEQAIRRQSDALCGPRAAIFARRLAADPKKDYQAFLDISRD